jgi:hypothetical protein
MFNNLDSDNDAEVGHMHSGRIFREVALVKLFKQNHEPMVQDEGFYSGEEEELVNEEHSESDRAEEGKTEDPCREESQTSGTAQTIEVSIITPPVVLATLSNQSNQSHQSAQSTVTSSPPYTHSGNLGRSMAYEMRLPTFRGDGSEDPGHH